MKISVGLGARRGASLALRRGLQAVDNVGVFLDPADMLGLPLEVTGDVGLLHAGFAHFPDDAAEFQPCAVDDVFRALFGALDLRVCSVEGSHRVGHLSIITPLMWPP